jgi:hypothetical protein
MKSSAALSSCSLSPTLYFSKTKERNVSLWKRLKRWLSTTCDECGEKAGTNPDCRECIELEDFRMKNQF